MVLSQSFQVEGAKSLESGVVIYSKDLGFTGNYKHTTESEAGIKIDMVYITCKDIAAPCLVSLVLDLGSEVALCNIEFSDIAEGEIISGYGSDYGANHFGGAAFADSATVNGLYDIGVAFSGFDKFKDIILAVYKPL